MSTDNPAPASNAQDGGLSNPAGAERVRDLERQVERLTDHEILGAIVEASKQLDPAQALAVIKKAVDAVDVDAQAASGFFLVRYLASGRYGAAGDWALYRAKSEDPTAARQELEADATRVELDPIAALLSPGILLNLNLVAESEPTVQPVPARSTVGTVNVFATTRRQRRLLRELMLHEGHKLIVAAVQVNETDGEPDTYHAVKVYAPCKDRDYDITVALSELLPAPLAQDRGVPERTWPEVMIVPATTAHEAALYTWRLLRWRLRDGDVQAPEITFELV